MEITTKPIINLLEVTSVEKAEEFFLKNFSVLTNSNEVIVLSISGKSITAKSNIRGQIDVENVNILEFEKRFSNDNFIIEPKCTLIKSICISKTEKTVYFPFIINNILRKIIILINPHCSNDIFNLTYSLLENSAEKILLKETALKRDFYFNEIFQKINFLIMIRDKNFNILFSNKPVEDSYKCFELAFQNRRPCRFCPVNQNDITQNINKKFYRIQQEAINDKRLCLIEDITNIISLRDELNKAEKLSFIGKISSEITHEIKNPLNAIQLKITLLENMLKKDNLLNEKIYKTLSGIKGEIIRLTNISNDFLQLGKNYNFNKVYFSLKKLIREVAEDLEEKCKYANIKTELIFHNDNGRYKIFADRDKLKQAFLNLLNNSIEELSSRKISSPEIKVEFYENKDFIQIDFIDNGTGIKEKDKIFTPFYTTKSHGTGLGLSITRKTVLAHNGKMEYFRKDNETFFRITLPKAVDN